MLSYYVEFKVCFASSILTLLTFYIAYTFIWNVIFKTNVCFVMLNVEFFGQVLFNQLC